MGAEQQLDVRSKLRSSKTVPPGFRNIQDDIPIPVPLSLSRSRSPTTVVDNMWDDQYDEHLHALNQLELRLSKQKRKVYEIQRVLQQNIEAATVLLSLLHSAIEEF